MAALAEYTSLIRSKNAGPFVLTFDIMFIEEENYRKVKKSGVLNTEKIASIYGIDPHVVKFFECDNALALKFSIPRRLVQGALGDADLHGGQQFAPLMEIQVP